MRLMMDRGSTPAAAKRSANSSSKRRETVPSVVLLRSNRLIKSSLTICRSVADALSCAIACAVGAGRGGGGVVQRAGAAAAVEMRFVSCCRYPPLSQHLSSCIYWSRSRYDIVLLLKTTGTVRAVGAQAFECCCAIWRVASCACDDRMKVVLDNLRMHFCTFNSFDTDLQVTTARDDLFRSFLITTHQQISSHRINRRPQASAIIYFSQPQKLHALHSPSEAPAASQSSKQQSRHPRS